METEQVIQNTPQSRGINNPQPLGNLMKYSLNFPPVGKLTYQELMAEHAPRVVP